MSEKLFRRLERFRLRNTLSILAFCKQLDTSPVNYHRWKKARHIVGPYKKILEDFLDRNDNPQGFPQSSYKVASNIAVIGIACYYPGANNLKDLWGNILARRVQFRRMLDQRLPLSQYYDADIKSPEKTYLTKAAFIENFKFDWDRLRIPRKTVESTDIAHWLALDTALKTFEDAGYKLRDIPLQNTGVIVGNTLTGEQTRSQSLRLRWPYVNKVLKTTMTHLSMGQENQNRLAHEMEKIYKSAFYPITEDSLSGGLANTIAGRICNYLNLKGGGYIVDGACSSSLLSVATAADALKMGNMDLALAGGVDVSLDPFELVGFAKAGALAKDQMRVYDQHANGFLPGEGCGFVLLKRLEDAIKDKNYIYAVIKGWGISSDGKGGIMEPSSSGQSFAIERAYKDLEYKISDVDFVEGHGTGTAKGDRVELEGIATAIAKAAQKNNSRLCGVTSFKSIVGHTKAAAGVGGLIKAICAVNQRILPPTANCSEPNDVFQDKAKGLYPIMQGSILLQGTKAKAGISSAGFGGINCHITVESKDLPKQTLKSEIEERALFVSNQKTEVFVFAARTTIHLQKVIQKFKEDLRNISIAEMADLAALLNKKARNRLPIKASIVADSPENLYEALKSLEKEITATPVEEGQIYRIQANDSNTHIILSHTVKTKRIGFIYPGQGSQRLNMTRTLVERYKWARDLLNLSKLPLYDLIYKSTDKFSTKEDQQEFEKQIADTKITQPAIIASSLIWTEFLSRLGIDPECVAGHSLGELIAFYRAGAFSKETLIKFAELRGRLMASRGRFSGSMVSLFCSKNQAEELIGKVTGNIVIANINSPTQVIVSGGHKEIERTVVLAEKEGISLYRLNVSNAFHSSFMKEASEKIQSSKILPDSFKVGDIKVYSGMSATALSSKVNLKEYFSKQVISPVSFVDTIEAISKNCDVLIEVGPGRVATDLIKAINKQQAPLCLPIESTSQNDKDLNIVLAELFVRNIVIKWEELYTNRLIKTFVPVSRKTFIRNQCEHPLKIGSQVLRTEISSNIELKQEVEEIKPQSRPVAHGQDNIADLLVDLIQAMTGFDRGSISLKSRLLDDLNLDSIKAAELIGQAAKVLGIAGQLDPSRFSNHTVEQIRDHLYKLVGETKSSQIEETTASLLKRYHDKNWVRNFVVDFKQEEIISRNVNQLKNLKSIVILSGKGEDALVNSIKKEFSNSKAKFQKIYFGDSQQKLEKFGTIDCLIVVLPKAPQNKDFDKNSFQEIVERLHQSIKLANSKQVHKDSFVVLVQFKNITSSCSKSIASTLYLERPDLKVRILDFDASASEKQISPRIIDELQTYERFNTVEYDLKFRRSVGYYQNSEPATYKKRNSSWTSKDVVLVTGGAKGVTAQCALEFARSTKARMVLVGRSLLPGNQKDENNEILQTLRQFDKEGLKAYYYPCDVTNEKQVSKTIQEIEKKLGKITGFVHGSGLNSLKRLQQVASEDAFEESLPKVMGAVNVCKAMSQPPKLIAGITSIIGLTGMEGSGWYGLANEVLNLYLHQFKNQNPQTDVVTIAYSVWDEIGMGAKLGSIDRLAEKGIGAIPVAEGVKRFKQLIENDPGTQQVIVAGRLAGIDTWKSATLKINYFRFIEKVEYILPEVELIARVHLNIKDDVYLLDHNWKGSLLFPFVFGFEAMAQGVAYVLGIEKFDYIKAKNINLERPISVPQESGTTIEIHAQVLERKKNDDSREVKVEIYSQETGYKEPHFSAVFEVDKKPKTFVKPEHSLMKKAKKVIDLDMQTDIYGPILFQGKLFQCIEKIHQLHYDKDDKKGQCVFTASYNKSTRIFLKENKKFKGDFLIGDPFFIDSVLQSMQLIIPQDLSLPRKIRSIELTPLSRKFHSEMISQSYIKKVNSEYYSGDAEVALGGFVLKIKNCHLIILETLSNNLPTNDLVNPALRDQKIIQTRVDEFSKELNFISPIICCLYDERLKNTNKDLRRKIEAPLVKVAVEKLFERSKKPVKSFTLSWLNSGKPVIGGKNVQDIGVSISHYGAFLMVIVGYGEQGCDVENIQERNMGQWLGLLGKNKYKLLEQMIAQGNNLNVAGTSIWGATEAIKKFHGKSENSVQFVNVNSKYSTFKSADLNENKQVITFVIRQKIIISLIVNFVISKEIGREAIRLGYNANVFRIDLQLTGSQEQPVYIQRFPITFKNVKDLGKRVYFADYFDWIGEVREYGLYPIKHELISLFETGKWGMATNHVKLRILGALRIDDIVEARLWLNRVSGEKNSVLDLMFEWFRVTSNDEYEKVALSEQRVSWIQITGHGEGKIESFPKSINEFIDMLGPRKKHVDRDENQARYRELNLGEQRYLLESTKNLLLTEEIFSTSLEESNLVGNIYFSNYAKWLGKTRDNYFRDLLPSYYLGKGEKGEFICLDCEIFHLMEAMPFDKIRVKMFLKKAFQYGLDFYFEFLKYKDGQESKRLAYGTHRVVFGKSDKGKIVRYDLPVEILKVVNNT